jgi:hypothetical protein
VRQDRSRPRRRRPIAGRATRGSLRRQALGGNAERSVRLGRPRMTRPDRVNYEARALVIRRSAFTSSRSDSISPVTYRRPASVHSRAGWTTTISPGTSPQNRGARSDVHPPPSSRRHSVVRPLIAVTTSSMRAARSPAAWRPRGSRVASQGLAHFIGPTGTSAKSSDRSRGETGHLLISRARARKTKSLSEPSKLRLRVGAATTSAMAARSSAIARGSTPRIANTCRRRSGHAADRRLNSAASSTIGRRVRSEMNSPYLRLPACKAVPYQSPSLVCAHPRSFPIPTS